MIKIGILCKDLKYIRHFEYRIIKEIIEDNDLELSLLIFDGRKTKKRNSFLEKIFRDIKNGQFISKVILKIQEVIENKLFKINNNINIHNLNELLKNVDRVFLNPERKGHVDFFTNSQSEQIRKYNLDIILRHEFNIIKGSILNSSKNGIWSFHHADNRINRGGPSCFWEIILKQQNVGVTLQKLTPELDGGYIIDRSSYNRHWSWIKTRNIVQESSVSLLMKNINRLKQNKITYQKSALYYHKLYKFPGLFYSIKYISSFYYNIILRVFKRINAKLFNAKYSYWTLIISKGNFFNSVLHKLKPIKPPSNEFWADPFIAEHKGNKYVFFENYEYEKSKGKISCGKIVNNNLIEIEDVLDKDYHLSYPNIFSYDNEFFMIPEANQNSRLEIYKCVSFPNKWELYSSAFQGEQIVDCNFYKDNMNQNWLFLNKRTKDSDDCSDLYIYHIDSLELNTITPHSDNPVVTNSSIARNAGPIFNYNDKIFRPSQRNIDGIYGKGLNINQIITLNLNEYKEVLVKKCLPFFQDNLQGIHHLHQTKDLFVIDICYKKNKN